MEVHGDFFAQKKTQSKIEQENQERPEHWESPGNYLLPESKTKNCREYYQDNYANQYLCRAALYLWGFLHNHGVTFPLITLFVNNTEVYRSHTGKTEFRINPDKAYEGVGLKTHPWYILFPELKEDHTPIPQ